MSNNIKPLVSVIVLTYNNFKRISETIISVLRQDYPNIELIIAEDCSKTFPTELVNNVVNENRKSNLVNFCIINNENNVGTVKNLNNSIKSCQGEIIFCFGSDDMFVDKNTISSVVDIFLQNNCDAVYTSRILYSDDKIRTVLPHVADWAKIKKLNTKMSLYSSFITTHHYSFFIGVTTTYKKTAIVDHNYFDEHYRLLEDLPMTEKMLWNNNVVLCPELPTILYECKYGVSAKGQTNPILKADLNYYNLHGKLAHYNELDNKTKRHIDFGIRRTNNKNNLGLIPAFFKYFPQLIRWICYCFSRGLAGYKDSKVIRNITLDDYKSFLS